MPLYLNGSSPSTASQSVIAGVANTQRQGGVRVNQGGGMADGAIDLWASGMSDVQLMDTMFYNNYMKDGRFFLQKFMYLMERFGNKVMHFPVASSTWNHWEQGKPYQGVKTHSWNHATGTLTVYTGSPEIVGQAGTVSNKYLMVGDQLNSPFRPGIIFRVKSVGALTGTSPNIVYPVVVERIDGQALVAGDFAANQEIGATGSSFHEQSVGPDPIGLRNGRIREHNTTITRKSIRVSGSALAQKTSFLLPNGGQGVLPAMFLELWRKHAEHVEDVLMWQQPTPSGGGPDGLITGAGLMNIALNQSGSNSTFGASLTEAALQDWLDGQRSISENNRFIAFTGGGFLSGVNSALQGYTQNGATLYGSFAGSPDVFQKAGINFDGYTFAGCTLDWTHYRGFDDRAKTGVAAASASAIDYTNLALIVADSNVGAAMDSAGNIRVSVPSFYQTYRQFGGINRRLIVGHLPGMTGLSGGSGGDYNNSAAMAAALTNKISTSLDADELHCLSEVGFAVVAPELNLATFRKSA